MFEQISDTRQAIMYLISFSLYPLVDCWRALLFVVRASVIGTLNLTSKHSAWTEINICIWWHELRFLWVLLESN